MLGIARHLSVADGVDGGRVDETGRCLDVVLGVVQVWSGGVGLLAETGSLHGDSSRAGEAGDSVWLVVVMMGSVLCEITKLAGSKLTFEGYSVSQIVVLYLYYRIVCVRELLK